ncbi:flagellar biosynthetic protein FliO [Cellulomonas endophytica]|uniref:flagellar biosynthetic protein FliO n=1 Tax=Cellulomonas endophytica TaxID=2494735 RepID=UPI0013E98E65|nr:flagellar biosynthetic protein FliO [Cellulomonas endophytica]
MDATALTLALRVVLSLAVVVGLVWVLGRKAGGSRLRRLATGADVRVVGKQSLGKNAGVAVVAVGERRLLLGYGEQQVSMITELDAVPDEELVLATQAFRAPRALRPGTRRAALPSGPASVPAADAEPPAGDALDAADAVDVADAPRAVDAGWSGAAWSALTALDEDAPAAVAVPGQRTRTAVPATAVPATAGRVAVAAPARTARPVAAADLAGATVGELPELLHLELSDVRPTGPLAGSVLSPSTWRRAVRAVQDRTVRR